MNSSDSIVQWHLLTYHSFHQGRLALDKTRSWGRSWPNLTLNVGSIQHTAIHPSAHTFRNFHASVRCLRLRNGLSWMVVSDLGDHWALLDQIHNSILLAVQSPAAVVSLSPIDRLNTAWMIRAFYQNKIRLIGRHVKDGKLGLSQRARDVTDTLSTGTYFILDSAQDDSSWQLPWPPSSSTCKTR